VPILVPVPSECVHQAARRYQVPIAVVYAILKVEDGRPGYGLKNRNGTIDWGPMQINSRWFEARTSPVQKQFPDLDPEDIKTDPCINVEVGVWILRKALNRDHSLWRAVGHYHSYRDREARRYRNTVHRWYVKIRRYWAARYGAHRDRDYAQR